MISQLINEYLTIEINSYGAELSSIRSNYDDTEYLWQANADHWGRSAPVLFPIVGKLNDNQYRYNNKEYNLEQHGFARNMEFDITAVTQDKITYILKSNEISMEYYPFIFELQIDYILKDKTFTVEYTVKNMETGMMYFSIGAHPGFNCPIQSSEKMEDYYLEFECDENISSFSLEKGLVSKDTELFLRNDRIVKLTPKIFSRDAIILKGLKSNKVSLKSKISNKALTVEFRGFPYLGIWSMSERSPFLCIEPWYGIADNVDFKGDIAEKEGILQLKPSCNFNCHYKIVVEDQI